MSGSRRRWQYQEQFLDHVPGVRPMGFVWIDGKEVWEFSGEGTTDADASTTIPIAGLPAGAVIDKILPMFPAFGIEVVPGILLPSSTIDAADLALVVVAGSFDIIASHSATFQSKPYRVACQFTLA